MREEREGECGKGALEQTAKERVRERCWTRVCVNRGQAEHNGWSVCKP